MSYSINKLNLTCYSQVKILCFRILHREKMVARRGGVVGDPDHRCLRPCLLGNVIEKVFATIRFFVFSCSDAITRVPGLSLHLTHGTIIRTGIICKKIPCYMRDSACRWFIVKKAKIF